MEYRKIYRIMITKLLLLLLALASGLSHAEEPYAEGDLVCAPEVHACGILKACSDSKCEILKTHQIRRNLVYRLSPEHMESLFLGKETIYGGSLNLKNLTQKVKRESKEATRPPIRHQTVCYELGYENSNRSDTFCGRVKSCNDTQCLVDETHKKEIFSGEGGSGHFMVREMPIAYDVQRTVNLNKLEVEGPTLEDLLLWKEIEIAFHRILT